MRRLITAALLALALGSAQAATQMEQLAKQMHPSEFPAQIEKLLNSGKAAQALELGDLGIRYGYQRFMPEVMWTVVIVLIILVQGIQSFGDWIVRRISHK